MYCKAGCGRSERGRMKSQDGKLPKQMSLYPTSSILAASKPKALQYPDTTVSHSKKNLNKQLPEVYRHHLQDLISSMQESKRRLRKQKNKIIRAIREKKQHQTRRQKEDINRYLQQQIHQEHFASHDRKRDVGFDSQGKDITFTNFKNHHALEGEQSAPRKIQVNKSRIQTQSQINPEETSQKIKNKGQTEQTLGTKRSQGSAMNKLKLNTSLQGQSYREQPNKGQ